MDRIRSKKEIARKDQYDSVVAGMISEGYECRMHPMNYSREVRVSFLMMLTVSMILYAAGNAVAPEGGFLQGSIGLGPLLIGFTACVLLHELLHGLTWALFSERHIQGVLIGFCWKYLTPYCSCRYPMEKRGFLLGIVMPTMILGFGMAVLSITLRNGVLFLYSFVMLFGGSTDVLLALRLLRNQDGGKDILYMDNPCEYGFVTFEKDSGQEGKNSSRREEKRYRFGYRLIGNESGQSMIEFAVILPILLLLILVPVDFYRYIDMSMTLNSAAADSLNCLKYEDIEAGNGSSTILNAVTEQYGEKISASGLRLETFETSGTTTSPYTYYVYSSARANSSKYQDKFDARASSYEHCHVKLKLSCDMKPLTFWGAMFLGRNFTVRSKDFSREIYAGGYTAGP